MIYSEATNIRIDHLVYFGSLSQKQLEKLREDEQHSGVSFRLPEHIRTNREKLTYKVGFLFEFLKKLYPEKKRVDLCDILNKRYEVFIEQRQIYRYVKNFKETEKFH